MPDLYYYVGTDGRTYQGYMPGGGSVLYNYIASLTEVCLEYLLPNDSVSPKSSYFMLLAMHKLSHCIQGRTRQTR